MSPFAHKIYRRPSTHPKNFGNNIKQIRLYVQPTVNKDGRFNNSIEYSIKYIPHCNTISSDDKTDLKAQRCIASIYWHVNHFNWCLRTFFSVIGSSAIFHLYIRDFAVRVRSWGVAYHFDKWWKANGPGPDGSSHKLYLIRYYAVSLERISKCSLFESRNTEQNSGFLFKHKRILIFINEYIYSLVTLSDSNFIQR